MSVLIKGMKMPENCDNCFFVGRGYPDWCGIPWIPKEEDEIDDTSVRPDWCPLVALPEKHGRLIDELVAYDKIAEQEGGYYMDMDGVDMGLQETPTVIEAEDGE